MGTQADPRLTQLSWRLEYLRREIVRTLGAQAVASSPEERARLQADEEALRRMASRAEEALMRARQTPCLRAEA